MENYKELWYSRDELVAVLADIYKTEVSTMQQWFADVLDTHTDKMRENAVSIHFSWSKTHKCYGLGFYPSDNPRGFTMDGRNSSAWYQREGHNRFSQKNFDIEFNHWKPYSQLLAALYLLWGHEHPKDCTELLNEIARHLHDHTLDIKQTILDRLSDLFGLTGELTNSTNPSEESAEHTTPDSSLLIPNSNNNMEQTNETALSINPAVVHCIIGSHTEQKVSDVFNLALQNNAMCIYNVHIEGDPTVYDTPKIVPLREALGLGEGEKFYGFDEQGVIKMVDLRKDGNWREHPIPEHMDLSPESQELFKAHSDDLFKWKSVERITKDAVLIRMEQSEGSWYEYLINVA